MAASHSGASKVWMAMTAQGIGFLAEMTSWRKTFRFIDDTPGRAAIVEKPGEKRTVLCRIMDHYGVQGAFIYPDDIPKRRR